MQEKYGFVYIWYDRKHKRYYIGCHWGTEDDGYICSSSWMKQAFKRRPQDFKRRILTRVYTNRKDMFLEEYNYLSLIKEDELGKKYYNLKVFDPEFHWSSTPEKSKIISEKISSSWTPELRAKLSDLKRGDSNPMKDPEVARKATKSRMENNPNWGDFNKGIVRSKEQRQHHSKKIKELHSLGVYSNLGPSKLKGIKHTRENNLAHVRYKYEVTHPNGNIEIVEYLGEWCKINNYNETSVRNSMTKNRKYRKMKICKR